MAHTFLALDMGLIPQSTKDNIPTFWMGMFSNEGSKMLIDGYNSDRVLVHSQKVLSAWLQWEDSPQETQEALLSSAIEYTNKQIKSEQEDVNSIWYIETEGVN